MAGDFILAVASMMIAKLRNDDVTLVLSQVSCRAATIAFSHETNAANRTVLPVVL